MAFTRVCGLNDVPVDTMDSYLVDDVEVLVVHGSSGVHAFDGICPHEEFPLVDGYFDDSTIVCIGHGWIFDAGPDKRCTRQGVVLPSIPSGFRTAGSMSTSTRWYRRPNPADPPHGFSTRRSTRHARTGNADLPGASRTADVIFDLVSLLSRAGVASRRRAKCSRCARSVSLSISSTRG